MLNSLRAIEMLGGKDNKVAQIEGQFSRNLSTQRSIVHSQFLHDHVQSFNEMYSVSWKAKGDKENKSISDILKSLEKEGCPDVFLKSITLNKPWVLYDQTLLENRQVFVPFIFHAHPFKPSVFARLKGRMPSFPLYSRMREIRKILSTELDDETKKRWRDILLINYPHESLTNQDVCQIWQHDSCCILLKESRGKFDLMEIDEGKV